MDPPARHYQEGADAQNYITQKQVDRNRSNRESSSQDFDLHSNNNYEPGGASCFTLNIHNTRMPKGFKLTAEIVKFDGTQDPRLWLEDYLIACNCQVENQITTMPVPSVDAHWISMRVVAVDTQELFQHMGII